MKKLLILLLIIISSSSWGQNDNVLRVGFWNVQNLFDTINNAGVSDGLYTPQSKKKWDSSKYNEKLDLLSNGIYRLNVDFLGLCEVENRGVVEDLSDRVAGLDGRSMKIVHYNSCDPRGIDQSILYDPTKMHLIESGLVATSTDKPKRELLYALFAIRHKDRRDTIAFYVVHLPSKLGGEVAAINRERIVAQIDSLVWAGRYQSVVMGDMNDDVIKVSSMFNCAKRLQDEGKGSYTYKGVASMLDQILVTPKVKRGNMELRDNYGVGWSGRRKRASDHRPVKIDLFF